MFNKLIRSSSASQMVIPISISKFLDCQRGKVLFLVLTFTFIHLTQQQVSQDQYAEVLGSGIMFHEESKILLAEKLVHVEFLVPFPKFTFEVKTQIEERLQTLATMWATRTFFCPLDESFPFNGSSKPFNVNWLYAKVLDELQAAKENVCDMGNETSLLLTMEEQHVQRQKRGLPGAAVAPAGNGVFGSSIMIGNQWNGITGFFGSFQDTGGQIAENIDRLQQHASAFTDFVMEVTQEHDDNFCLIYNELKSISRDLIF